MQLRKLARGPVKVVGRVWPRVCNITCPPGFVPDLQLHLNKSILCHKSHLACAAITRPPVPLASD